jgi:single-strand DNA-binding protein
MASVNKVILVGNLGNDPDVRYTGSGQAVANFSIATTEKWRGKDGTASEKTEWHRIVVWGKLAELCKSYLTKGRAVYVEGRLQTRQWENKEGNTQYTTEVIANTIQFLGAPSERRAGNEAAVSSPAFNPAAAADSNPGFDVDSDIPF